MKSYLLGLLTGLILAGGIVYAESGFFYDSTGTQGVIIDQGGSGFYYDSTGKQGVYQGVTPVIPYTAGKSPC